MTKKNIRKIYRKKRMQLAHAEMEKFNDLILMQFQRIPLQEINFVHSYLSSDKTNEPDTSLILWYIGFRHPHVKVAAPKTDNQTLKMTSYVVTEDSVFEQNKLGIDEPVTGELVSAAHFDLVLVPLLAFDAEGYRVGHGKGYYDRFLSECRPDVVKVGLSYFGPVDSIDDKDELDRKSVV